MMYRNLIVALVLGLAGNTYAGQQEAADDASDDDRVACIQEAIAEEIEEGEQYDKYVESCYQEKTRARVATGKSPESDQ
jgi:hypothetical protein